MKKLCMILAILVFSSCFGKTDIIGKWKVVEPKSPFGKDKAVQTESDFIYFVFSKDNTVVIFTPIFNPAKGKFTLADDVLTIELENKGTQTYDIAHSSSTELIVKRKEDGYVMRMTR